ncbi:Elongator complex protein 6 [Holothuria leucospilota]|uniref:Elongator complex protein 6 n=1 Tax=Holothuria leucospilota TaxID=206669 RepID=A0A9Q1BDI5_HOLLE|nr:Elongator complex protein 6 [Holothuria leucospilota]
MIKDFNALIGWVTETIPCNQFILVTDCQTDGSFAIHNFLSTFVRSHHKVIFLSLGQSFGHYNSVAQKLGTNLSSAKSSGQLTHIDGLQFSLQLCRDSSEDKTPGEKLSVFTECLRCGSLRPLYLTIMDLIKSQSTSSTPSPVSVVIDDLSLLMSLGFKAQAITEFIHYCRTALWKLSQNAGNLVTLVHDDADGLDDDASHLVIALSHQTDMLIKVEGLTSGFSKDVHGQVTIVHRGLHQSTPGRRKATSVHYKILDKTVSFFPMGTSSAVL